MSVGLLSRTALSMATPTVETCPLIPASSWFASDLNLAAVTP